MNYHSEQHITKLNWNLLFVSHSKQHWDAMFRFCTSLVGKDKVRADDLLQTSLLKALKAFSKFVLSYNEYIICDADVDKLFGNVEMQQHFKNWLYKIIKNSYLDDKENNKKWQKNLSTHELEDFDFQSADAHSEITTSLRSDTQQDPGLIQKEENEFYRLALDDNWKKRFEVLNERQKSILFLSAENYSYKEISTILNVPIGTVMSTLSRTLQKLRPCQKME